ncbi:TonB-dependent receptor [Flammeovirga sp. MY04]|uniref:SusC/RagA family TonB-linked outer membrane protein n=1 Tax=Flammeovirga sp. MY04 TaxID=1191459 RepID=UPI00080641B8|nr:TonB-dependent receptor [Flammeovirga sp. MY04]ANQ51601.1 TonB-dependent receptor [Flammeovirga sp. MY04]
MNFTKNTKKPNFLLLYLTFFILFISGYEIQAQTVQLKGKVISSDDNLPLPGVNVLIQGTTSGTITNFDGEYQLMVERGDVLEFRFIGMETQVVVIKDQARVDVSLETSVKLLDELVKIGYGEQKKKEISGAVSHVKGDVIETFTTGDFGDALQGQIAGVSVSNTGAPGENAVIQIRGVSTVSDMAGATEPLYVVDGIPQNENPRLAPSEIETLDILKDLASCAIYGTRGANGVILITTKKGNKGKLNLSFNGTYGIKNITSDIPLMNSNEQIYFDIVKHRNMNGNHDGEMILPIGQRPEWFNNETDLRDVILLDNQPTQNYNLSVSGGSKGLTYNLTGGIYDDRGSVYNSGFSRKNARAGVRYKQGKWDINSSLAISSETTTRANPYLLLQMIRYKPYQPEVDPNRDDPVLSPGIGHSPESSIANQVVTTMRREDKLYRDRLQGNISIGYEFTENLNFRGNIGANSINDFRIQFNPFIPTYDSQGQLLSNNANSFVENSSGRRTGTSFDGRLTYAKKFGDHKFSAMLGASNEIYTSESFTARKYGVVDNSIRVLNGATLDAAATSGYNYTYKVIGTLGRLMYDYKGKYMFSMSGNYNGNSKFAKNNKWKFFPSVSGAWNVADEAFWDGMRGVTNNFKIRASHGQVGGQSFLPYTDEVTIQHGLDYPFGGAGNQALYFGAAQVRYANTEVQWETSIQNNFGIDVGFLDNKFTLVADIYHTEKADMLFPVQLPPSVGTGSGSNSKLTMNMGNMVNKGIEIALGYKGGNTKFNWSVNGTFTKNINEITNMNTDEFVYTSDNGLISGAEASSKVTVFAEGYEAGAFFLYKTDGIVKTTEQLEEFRKIKPDAQMGDLIYVDTNGDGEITDADRVYSGSGFSDWEAGLMVTLNWKGFDFMMHWYAAIGHQVMNGSSAQAYSEGRHKNQVSTWSEANPHSDIPAYRGGMKENDNFKAYTDLWLEDGSFVRLKNIQLGYTLPKSVLKKTGASNIRVFISAQNPLTFTRYTGYDPEVAGNGVSSRGLDKGNYPISAMYLTGFKLNF